MMKKIALTIVLIFGLTTLAVPNGDRLSQPGAADLLTNDNSSLMLDHDYSENQYDDFLRDNNIMMINIGIVSLVALAFYGIGYYVGKKKDKDKH